MICYEILNRLKETLEFVVASFYALYCKVFFNKTRRAVIYYHSINKSDVTGFKKQMSYLAKNCHVIKPSEIIMASEGGAQAVVAITFDDAFVNILNNAIPILKEYSLPAAVFVPADRLGQLPDWEIPEAHADKKELIMDSQQIKQLDKDGFEIFSHTLSHPKLIGLKDDTLLAELKNSKQFLEKVVGHEVIGISYPYGIYDNRVCRTVEKCGYKLGFTIKPCMLDSNTDAFMIGRFSVSPRDSLAKFKLKVSGAYQAVILLRKLKRKLLRT